MAILQLHYSLRFWKYDLAVHFCSLLAHLFYREIHSWGTERISNVECALFVAAPHSNDLADSAILMSVLLSHAKRRVSFLVAERLMKRKFIAAIARALGSVVLHRVWDRARLGSGTIFSPDFATDPRLIRGRETRFDKEAEVGGYVMVVVGGKSVLRAEIEEIRGPEELFLKREFRDDGSENDDLGLEDVLTDTIYSLAPKQKSTSPFREVFEKFRVGGAICLFPEGTSHDKPDLLPLKSGFAVIALSSLAENPYLPLRIVPCGLHFTHRHMFRSRAGVQFGEPIQIPRYLVEMFKSGEEREAVMELKNLVYHRLRDITLNHPDSRILESVQIFRQHYEPNSGPYPLDRKIALSQRILKRFSGSEHDSRVQNVLREANDYHLRLSKRGLRHSQVRYAMLSKQYALVLLLLQIGKFFLASVLTAPGLILFSPVLLLANEVSKSKARKAVASSPFKVEGRDVLAAWKALIAVTVSPVLYTFYFAVWVYLARQCLMPFASAEIVACSGAILLPAITLVSMYAGDHAMEASRSFRALLMLADFQRAREMRELFEVQCRLTAEIKRVVDSPDTDEKMQLATLKNYR